MLAHSALISDSMRDYEREQSILAIGRRISSIRMTDAWRAFVTSCIGEETPIDTAWQVVVGECLRCLVNARAITGSGLTVPEIAEWVSSLAERHCVGGLSQSLLERLARDMVVVGFMASGEEVHTCSMRNGRLVADHAPAVIEEREQGVYQPTLEAMDYAFRNLDYERAYGQVFHAKDIMLRRQVESGNYREAGDQVRALRRSIAMVRDEYRSMMDDGVGDMDAARMSESLRELATQMESISTCDDLDRIAGRLGALASSHPSTHRDNRAEEARSSLRHLMAQVDAARADIHEIMGLRPQAEAALEGRLSRGMVVRTHARTIDLTKALSTAVAGRVGVNDLIDILVVPISRPTSMCRILGWETIVAATPEHTGESKVGGVDIDSLTELVDEQQTRRDDAKASMGASLARALERATESGEALPLADWLSDTPEEERYEWMDTGVLIAFLHSLHAGRGTDGTDADWREWLGGELAERELALSMGDNEGFLSDAWASDGMQGWGFDFEGRRITIVE